MRYLATAALTILIVQTAPAQITVPEYEVASIKPSDPPNGGPIRVGMQGGPGTNDPGRIVFSNLSMRNLLANAYAVKNDQITGPDWLDSQRFDITAKVPAGATKEQAPAMLQKLLADRFHVVARSETKEVPIFNLTVAKGGLKMKASDPEVVKAATAPPPNIPVAPPGPGSAPPPGAIMVSTNGGAMTMSATASTIANLINLVTRMAGRPIVDKTGLTGRYDISLHFGGDPSALRIGGGPPLSGPNGPLPEAGEPAPSIFSALQDQLGLKLDPDKGPVVSIVIEHIEKVPTDN